VEMVGFEGGRGEGTRVVAAAEIFATKLLLDMMSLAARLLDVPVKKEKKSVMALIPC
jgi:hypothetical protein